MLKEVGIIVNQEEAELIMDFLSTLTRLILEECFEKDED